jgi:hypothetical protein
MSSLLLRAGGRAGSWLAPRGWLGCRGMATVRRQPVAVVPRPPYLQPTVRVARRSLSIGGVTVTPRRVGYALAGPPAPPRPAPPRPARPGPARHSVGAHRLTTRGGGAVGFTVLWVGGYGVYWITSAYLSFTICA